MLFGAGSRLVKMPEPILSVANISKSYGGVHALVDVDLEIASGEIHALCGENGAGKSTLIKILAGVVAPDSGNVIVGGLPLPLGNVHASEKGGIAVIHQEAVAFPHLDTYDNIFMGCEPRWFGGWLLDRRAMRQRTRQVFERLGESFPLERPVGELPLALRQMVAIARALSRRSRLLIMDEPTASLSARETTTLLRLARQLRDEGVSILYVSHRLDEIFQLAQRVTVLRDGRLVETCSTTELDAAGLIDRMVGRSYQALEDQPIRPPVAAPPVLEARQLRRGSDLCGVSLNLHPGEIVGLAGLVGAGRTELARALFGIDRLDGGVVRVAGKELSPGSVRGAMRAGLALVPEDRQHQGLVLPMAVGANLTMPQWKKLARWGILTSRREQKLVAELTRRLHIKAANEHVAAKTLSGGNQQKIVLGKWLALSPRILILDEPTRGVDVGAKAEIYRLIHGLAQEGMAILLISSELPEILLLSQRILVMREGEIVGELVAETATESQILSLAMPPATASTD